ncbi:DUF3393 domain-containing protein [Marinomonas sp. A79]|uniref:DUF3393 domain-containing protein n=1 Tax=Marinomonas vulgaris TaxID=2823372 RepID=A0ABS5HE71_9GAMM|nr:murein transglycosylase domain-containing protein [Marinomonas vulgaris]MBR7889956.1 DUF3393 domain-containing protein [Marinomonas vulgaris]
MKTTSKFAVLLLCLSVLQVNALSYDEWKASKQASYKEYQVQYKARYAAFKNKVLMKWGDKTTLSSQHQYVTYTDDLDQRTVLDYKNNEIVIESLSAQSPDVEKALLVLQSTTVNQALQKDPILTNVNIAQQSGSLLGSISDLESLDTLVKSGKAETDTAKVKESATDKRISRVRINLPDNVYVKRAEPFLPTASAMSQKHDVDSNLILAIAQTESSFNPLAQSPIPAFGLMQIVPSSAGLDVNQALNNKDQSPQASVLFQPEENIDFGAGYLHLLNTRYLKNIKDERSRLYCIIAAYNTGAGNVASVFHPQGRKVINPAVAVINKLTPEEVYQRLVKELPYKETQMYLQKVTKALAQYQAANPV